MEPNAILIDPRDNVVTVLRDIAAAEEVSWGGGTVRAQGPVPENHKVSIVPIPVGATVFKYGHAIGVASAAIEPGAHVHSHCMTGKG